MATSDLRIFLVCVVIFVYHLYMYIFKKDVIREYNDIRKLVFYGVLLGSLLATTVEIIVLIITALN